MAVDWGRVHSYLMLAAIPAAFAAVGAGMIAFGPTDPVRIVGMWLVGIFGFLTAALLIAAFYVWRTQARKDVHRPLPELGLIEFINFGGRVAEQFTLAFQPIDTGFKEVVAAYKKSASQYTPLLRTAPLRAQTLMREMAKEMTPSFEAIDQTGPRLVEISTIIAQGFASLAIEYENNPDPVQLRTSREQVSGLLTSVETLHGLHRKEFLGLLKRLRGKDSTLTAACNRGAQSLDAALSALDKIADSCRGAIKTADRLLRDRRRS